MSYSVFVQKFEQGEPTSVPFGMVEAILKKFGAVDEVGSRVEFIPSNDDLCEVGFVGGSRSDGIDSVGFEMPISGGQLGTLVFELLAVPGMCYFELDCTYVIARTDVSAELPKELLQMCTTGRVTVITSASEILV